MDVWMHRSIAITCARERQSEREFGKKWGRRGGVPCPEYSPLFRAPCVIGDIIYVSKDMLSF